MNKTNLGKEKEELACKYLENKGYKIIKRNFYTKFGEIDIIAKIKDALVFIEVRSKSNINFGYAEETINNTKIKKLIKTAQIFLNKTDIIYDQVRFDVIAINKDKINHIENAIEL